MRSTQIEYGDELPLDPPARKASSDRGLPIGY
jgi:hypothetical protein